MQWLAQKLLALEDQTKDDLAFERDPAQCEDLGWSGDAVAAQHVRVGSRGVSGTACSTVFGGT